MDTAVIEEEQLAIPMQHEGRLDWGAIWAGTLASIGVWILFTVFGLAVGLTSINPQRPNLEGVAIWLGIWSLVIPILALFPGVMLTGRAARVKRPLTGMMHGAVVWGMTTLVATFLVLFTAMAGLRAAWTATSATLSAAGQMASTVANEVPGSRLASGISKFFGIDRNTVLTAINQRLPAGQHVTLAQLQTSLQDAVETAIQRGQMNQEIIAAALSRHTPLSQADAQRIADQIQTEWDQTAGAVMGQLSAAAHTAAQMTLSAVRMVGANLWWFFGSVLLGLGAALGAGFLAAAERPHKHPREGTMPLRSPLHAGA